MSDDTEATAVAAQIRERIEQLDDPQAYRRRQINAAYDALAAQAAGDNETLSGIERLRALELAELEPPPPPPVEKSPTAADLALPAGKGSAVWKATQHVEPARDGAPWCDWSDAEAMLVAAARAAMRGSAGVAPTGYRLLRDETAMTLTLELT